MPLVGMGDMNQLVQKNLQDGQGIISQPHSNHTVPGGGETLDFFTTKFREVNINLAGIHFYTNGAKTALI